MKLELTDRYLRSLQPPAEGRIEISDTKRPGLRFRLSSHGNASWSYERRVKNGPKRKHNLGKWPTASLADARRIALVIEAEAARGFDRVAAAEQERVEAQRKKAAQITVQKVLSVYSDLHLSTLRSGDERKRQIEMALHNRLGLPIGELSSKHLQEAVDSKRREGRSAMANRWRAALVHFASWAWQRGYADRDITQRIDKASREMPRERVMSLKEVRSIYNASDHLGPLWGPLIKLLVLTAQRRSEITDLTWKEVSLDGERILKPGSKTKNGKPHVTHLSPPAGFVAQMV